ncbi:MAG: RagB/SusD family nutrient uptake outer membrane protein [Arcicella sp.]|jgi:hypothetical protein|nr:RagB/SusD family nutrient uptake outer membrane protein [Arcicella sp.]
MKRKFLKKIGLYSITVLMVLSSCEKKLDNVIYGDLSSTVGTADFAKGTLMAAYTGMVGGTGWQEGWGSAFPGWKVQALETTDEGVCSWGGNWFRLNRLDYDPDFDWTQRPYTVLMPFISRITVGMGQINKSPISDALKTQYIAEMKGLRAHYSQILYSLYGPLTIKTDPAVAADPNAVDVPRPTAAEMVKQIEADYKDAIAVLPTSFKGNDYGRLTKGAALTGLMKLYMQEKRWADAVATGEQIKQLGYSLASNYEDNFSMKNKSGGVSEVIFAVVCTATPYNDIANYTNIWMAHVIPGSYKDPSGIPLMGWGGYKMPWKTYDKFDQTDKRLKVLVSKYPTGKDANGNVTYVDLRATGAIGALPIKYLPDGWTKDTQYGETDVPVYRYADVLLMLAEARNEVNGGPNATAYDEINTVRKRAGLAALPAGLSKSEFLAKIQDERLFELWAEGFRREDLVRWGLYVKRAKDDGSVFATPEKVLYPLPRAVITRSNGVIKQNPGYN